MLSEFLGFDDNLLFFFGAQVLKRSQRYDDETIGVVEIGLRPHHCGNALGQFEHQLLPASSAQSVDLPVHNPQDGADHEVGADRDVFAVITTEDEELGAEHRHGSKSGDNCGQQRRVLSGGKYLCTISAQEKVRTTGERAVNQKVEDTVSIEGCPQRLVPVASYDFRKPYQFSERDREGGVPNRRERARKDYL